MFYQLYTVHGFVCGRALPLVYCSISGKSETIYGELFDVILNHISQRPKTITMDFEKAVENVIKDKLPTTTVTYCFFHFKQALWRKVQVGVCRSGDKNLSLKNPNDILSFYLGTWIARIICK